MALDPSIILQGRGVQLDNPIDTQNKLAQLQQTRNQNRLADITFADNQRERAGENSLSQLLADGKSGDDVVRGLAAQGYGKSGLAYGKQFQERQKGQADILKAQADTLHLGAQTSETQAKVMNLAAQQHKDAIGLVNDRETAAGWLQSMYSDPRLKDIVGASGTTVEQAIARIPSDAAGLEKWKMQAALGGDKLIAMTMPDANARLTAQTSRANNVATNAITMRGQNMVDARATKTAEQGSIPPGYRVNADGTMEAIPGGPAYGKITDAQQKFNDAESVINLLNMADPPAVAGVQVPGLIDQSTQGYIGVAGDAFQAAMGRSTPGAQAAAQLRALEGALISKMPKMSGPQSDRDVLLYRQMAGQIGDPTIPAGTKKAAIRTIREINERYLGGNATAPTGIRPPSSPVPGNQPAKPNLPQGWSVEVK